MVDASGFTWSRGRLICYPSFKDRITWSISYLIRVKNQFQIELVSMWIWIWCTAMHATWEPKLHVKTYFCCCFNCLGNYKQNTFQRAVCAVCIFFSGVQYGIPLKQLKLFLAPEVCNYVARGIEQHKTWSRAHQNEVIKIIKTKITRIHLLVFRLKNALFVSSFFIGLLFLKT